MAISTADFVSRWRASGAEERANKDLFFAELCDVLDVPRPAPKTGDPARDVYVFEADVRVPHEGLTTTVRKIDVYRAGAFILEAKQGQEQEQGDFARKLNKAKRGTPAWEEAMNGARGQALGYARMMDRPPPFLVIADLGHCFDLYASFDGTDHYTPFPNPRASRLFFGDLEKHAAMLRAVFTDPLALDPSLKAAKVTREVAEHLAALAQSLEKSHPAETVATFLMRCLFTMFAEDAGLLPEYPATKQGLFTGALEHLWKQSPGAFPGGIESLWRAMNSGAVFGFFGKLLRFNGGLFIEPAALPLTAEQLGLLLDAAKCNWSDVEPAIFGTLIERALDEKERHALGAHYTPRAYVERLVRPTIEEPLRADWDLVQAEVRQLVEQDKVDAAKKAVRAFHQKLCALRVLDPACGSGNFLYVALDLFQRLEGEVLAKLEGLGEKQQLLHAESIRVTPAQFLGIEKKRWAKEIAELVLWIGYLQHHVRTYGKATPPPEPVLQDYKNIECRDAVLTWDREELVRDDKGKPVTRWDGETTKTHPVTGAEVPDEKATVPVVRYVNPRKAEWPKADFVVGNPPFLGKLKTLTALGDGYVLALRAAFDEEVEDGSDYVLYWWHLAAEALRAGKLRRFGLVSTNSISQASNRRLLQAHLTADPPIHIAFAIPDHPWVDSGTAADVRIAMTVAARGPGEGTLMRRRASPGSHNADTGEFDLANGIIHPDLTAGPNLARAALLLASRGLASPGVEIHGQGFVLTSEQASMLRPKSAASVIRDYRIGKELTAVPRDRFVIDLDGLDIAQVRAQFPKLYQWVNDHVRPERVTNREAYRRDFWWLFARRNVVLRTALRGLPRFIGTVLTAKHRVFIFLPGHVLPDQTIVGIGLDDAVFLGVLSSRAHVVWAMAAGGRLGVGNDPRYTKTRCFDPFPFPVCTLAQAARIRSLGEDLDAHRKRQQAAHPGLTITGMYNVLEKLRSGEALTAKEKVIHEEGLVSVLKQLHDDLDAAVFDAYGWPEDLTGEQLLEKLVALNAERAEEEKNGLVRWLRPDFQNPGGAKAATQVALAGVPDAEASEGSDEPAAPAAQTAWPKGLPEQIAAVRDLVLRGGNAWTAKQAAAPFKGISAKGVAPVLDSLAALGIVVAYEQGGERRWRAARAG